MNDFSHLDKIGNAKMVDVSNKKKQLRVALAEGEILLSKTTIDKILENNIAKGSVLGVAKVAGIVGAKQTSTLIPLCHNIFLNSIDIDFEIKEEKIICKAKSVATDVTGVEMEALMAVNISLLTIYDMCKAIDKKMIMTNIRLLKKDKYDV